MSEDFNEMVDQIARRLKETVGPFGALFNPQSSKATGAQVQELKDRIANQDRTINTLTGAAARFEADLNAKTRELTEVTLERDALREQISPKDKPGEPTKLKKP